LAKLSLLTGHVICLHFVNKSSIRERECFSFSSIETIAPVNEGVNKWYAPYRTRLESARLQA
ncbi:MAG: hypothetical protein ACTIDT_12795, partial [Halomonas sp.]